VDVDSHALHVAEGCLTRWRSVGVGRALQRSRRLKQGNGFLHELLYLPWVIKPLWSPVVELLKTRRIVDLDGAISSGAVLRGHRADNSRAAFFPAHDYFFWLLAFSSATHDIAADGFYMLATTEREQSFSTASAAHFTTWQNHRAGRAGLFAGDLQKLTGSFITRVVNGSCTCCGNNALRSAFIIVAFCRNRRMTGRKSCDAENFSTEFLQTFGTFFQKPKIIGCCCFFCCSTAWARRNS
jgi:PAT family beta-lactamase induction signal transducer AmpG